MTSEPSYTNVRMDANSPLGQWWRHQSDRDYSMQVLVQLANQKFGKNVDLKAYSLQQMINGNVTPTTSQPQTPVETTTANKPESSPVAEPPFQRKADELSPNQKTTPEQATTPNPQPTVPPTTVQPSTHNDASAAPDDDALVHDALFGGAAKPVKKARKPGQSFREQL